MFIRRSLVALLLCLAFSAHAADELLDTAQKMLGAGRGADAYALLVKEEDRRSGEPAFDLVLGAAALQAGQPTRAVFALERVLAQQPNNGDARALIGQAYLVLGEFEASRLALRDAQQLNPPPAVSERIARLLGQIDDVERRQTTQVSGFIEATLGHDSNVNSATSSQAVAIPILGGAIATLAPGAVRQGDEYLGVAAGIGVRHRIDPHWSVLARAGASVKFNFDRDQFDNRSLDGSAGVNFEQGGNQFYVAAQLGSLSVDDRRFREYAGLLGQWRHALSQNAEASVYVQHGRLSYPGQAIRDADRTVVGAAYVRALPWVMSPTVFGSLYAGEENEVSANVPHLGHRLMGGRIGVELTLAPKWTGYGSIGVEHRDYGGQEPFFLTARDDRQWDLQIGARYALARNWTLQPSVSHVNNDSNVAIFKFDRTLVNITLRREFK